MSNTENPNNNKQQPAPIPTDYGALLAMTRPLIIHKHTLLSWRGGEVCHLGFGTLPEPGDRRAESALKRGEILGSDDSEPGAAKGEGLATTAEQAGTSHVPEGADGGVESASALYSGDSHLQIRICLGMS